MDFVDSLLNDKTIILLNLAEYRLILAKSACDLVGKVSGDIPRDFAGKFHIILNVNYLQLTESRLRLQCTIMSISPKLL